MRYGLIGRIKRRNSAATAKLYLSITGYDIVSSDDSEDGGTVQQSGDNYHALVYLIKHQIN